MKVVAIIQARMTSSRFPGKHLAPLNGRAMITHVYDRVVPHVDEVIVATSIDRSDEPLTTFLRDRGAITYRGSLGNPLERMYRAALESKADVVVRVTGDCPLVDSRVIKSHIAALDGSDLDYVGVTNSPDGNDVEVFTMKALEAAYVNASPDEVEHTTTWIRKNMKCDSVESNPLFADVHYSVNTVEDLKKCEALIKECGEGARWQDYVGAHRRLYAVTG